MTQILGKPATPKAEAVPPLIPVARYTWWAGVKSGRFPHPVRGLGPRITAWRAEDIRALMERLNDCVAGDRI
nr:AlpA family phage regulatory protein [Luteimonas sp. BDR2-5]